MSGEEREPNNNREQAIPLGVTQTVTGWLAPADDEDWFRIGFPADDRDVDVDVEPNGDLAVELGVFSADGHLIFSLNYDHSINVWDGTPLLEH